MGRRNQAAFKIRTMEFNLKRFFLALCVSLLIAGCAGTAFKNARANANLVTNGMTIQQAIDVIGTPPTTRTTTELEWRRGNAQHYNATPSGAISFHVKNGVIVDVPEGGIFSTEARRLLAAEWDAQQKKQTDAAAEAARKRDAELAARAAEVRDEIGREANAAADAKVACNVKSTCAKVFALAQIYITTETDQKIQVVTDSVIQTYNPTEILNVGASILKVPGRGDDAEVSLSLTCKTGSTDASQSACRLKNTKIYLKFKPFIEARLIQ